MDQSINQSVKAVVRVCLVCVCVCVCVCVVNVSLSRVGFECQPFSIYVQTVCVCVCVKERERATAKQKDERLMSESARPPVGSLLTEPIVGERQTTGTDGVVVVFVVADVSYWPKAKKKKHLLR